MEGNITQRAARLAFDLLRHPRYIPRYVAHNLINGVTPLDLECPWFSYAAIDFLRDYLRQDMTICEYGSGGSTIFFARHARSVFSIEDSPSWYERVSERVRSHDLSNVTLKLCPFEFKDPVGFERSAYLHSIPQMSFDVIVVDGAEEWVPVRPTCFRHAEKFIKPGGIIVVDDSWRYPELRSHNHAQRVQRFQSSGPCRPGVTSTDLFFY